LTRIVVLKIRGDRRVANVHSMTFIGHTCMVYFTSYVVGHLVFIVGGIQLSETYKSVFKNRIGSSGV
jgi:hypothetical protein